MTTQAFLILLTVCSAVTSLLTEAVKKALGSIKYSVNIVVLILSIVIGCGSTFLYYATNEIPLTALNIVYIFLMGIANWVGATVGYDKVKQTFHQIVDKEV